MINLITLVKYLCIGKYRRLSFFNFHIEYEQIAVIIMTNVESGGKLAMDLLINNYNHKKRIKRAVHKIHLLVMQCVRHRSTQHGFEGATRGYFMRKETFITSHFA